MKTILEQTRNNLMLIKDKMCYNDEGSPKCYKCNFAKFNSDIDDDDMKWMCLLDETIKALDYHLYFFPDRTTNMEVK